MSSRHPWDNEYVLVGELTKRVHHRHSGGWVCKGAPKYSRPVALVWREGAPKSRGPPLAQMLPDVAADAAPAPSPLCPFPAGGRECITSAADVGGHRKATRCQHAGPCDCSTAPARAGCGGRTPLDLAVHFLSLSRGSPGALPRDVGRNRSPALSCPRRSTPELVFTCGSWTRSHSRRLEWPQCSTDVPYNYLPTWGCK